MKLVHEITVHCPAEEAYEFCRDVSNWPTHFPPCLQARVLDESDGTQHIRLTAWGKEALFLWESERKLNQTYLSIGFRQKRPMPLVTDMAGKWVFKKVAQNTCHIELWHEFTVRENVQGIVPGIETPEAALQYMVDIVNANSDRELAAIKETLEQRLWSHEFEISVDIGHEAEAVYQLLRKYSYWPELLPHCSRIDTEYDDGEHQIYTMTVRVGDHDEVIRTIRHCANGCINYFQPAPPDALTAHKGSWELEQRPGGVTVTSWHKVVLNREYWVSLGIDAEVAKQRVAQSINANSRATIMTIDKKLNTRGERQP
ncbi:aromatase/cyclase [Paludibacterium paludis]|uniref:Coenzyme Q-binding protein COQ10 START domain-containing protein n=1 Tax=Paludibacterium paludis TaxID=1225769 RepID=A0A918P0Z5_9NEIS|nr:SRPBCC family protein [Paludibacterium paludis]GGY11334.1 hypothetical protein GCM10011289_12830 [Paludibacterium paludis]